MSDEQVARYRRFRGEVTVGELEQFFRLDAKARAVVAGKRRPAAARHVASAMEILMSEPQATEDRLVSLAEVWNEIERVVPRQKLTAAVEVIASFVPETDDDAAAALRAEVVKRYRTVQQFIELLLEVIDFRAVEIQPAANGRWLVCTPDNAR
ncbi:hypothetical protein ACFLIM_42625 [Nonomuraea sp. M3C6]|uniref:DUF4158 domain-containing protein n=1 Tax=Nonomuraea marmarensis TaxID=3351344 RepID=A0ABW7AR34_9ACTN